MKISKSAIQCSIVLTLSSSINRHLAIAHLNKCSRIWVSLLVSLYLIILYVRASDVRMFSLAVYIGFDFSGVLTSFRMDFGWVGAKVLVSSSKGFMIC